MAHILSVAGKTPQIAEGVFLAPTASITAEVVMERDSSAFYGVSVRGDTDAVHVGEGTNLQDNVVLHAEDGSPTVLGRRVSVGHNAVVHGATVGDHCLIGMSATVLNRAVIGPECLIAAGALVTQGMEIPPRSLVAGVPAKLRRELTEEEVAHLHRNAETYLRLKEEHLRAEPA